MRTTRITAVEPNWPLVDITLRGNVFKRYKGIPERIGVHDAINYRAKQMGTILPFLREYPTYYRSETMRFHLPYFRNCQEL